MINSSTPPPPPSRWRLVDLEPLHGGVSGATVLRGRLTGCGDDRRVVIKHTDRLEAEVLELLAALDEPLFPRLLDVSDAGDMVWLMIDFHRGRPAGISAGLSEQVHRAIGRMHAHFADRPGLFPADAERIGKPFLLRTLTSFGPDQLAAAGDRLSTAARRTGTELMQRLADDESYLTFGRRLDRTVLHGDLYGLNVLLPTEHEAALVIDWNVARIGPAMFDVAMTAPYDSDARRAHDAGWVEVTGRAPDSHQDQLAHAWCSSMINIGYAGVVAVRSSPDEGERMIFDAVEAADRWSSLLGC